MQLHDPVAAPVFPRQLEQACGFIDFLLLRVTAYPESARLNIASAFSGRPFGTAGKKPEIGYAAAEPLKKIHPAADRFKKGVKAPDIDLRASDVFDKQNKAVAAISRRRPVSSPGSPSSKKTGPPSAVRAISDPLPDHWLYR
jgi:hypothetical protein